MQQSIVNDDGERVIPATRRPDGTWRKERKVRAGYTPQDEQPLYQSTATVYKNTPSIACPGWDGSVGSQPTAKSKTAKKNEKRKAKKYIEVDDASPSSLNAVTQAAADLSVSEPSKPLDPVAILDKQRKTTMKKIRQCDALLERRQQGQELNDQEKEKLSKLAGWQADIERLDEEIAQLAQAS